MITIVTPGSVAFPQAKDFNKKVRDLEIGQKGIARGTGMNTNLWYSYVVRCHTDQYMFLPIDHSYPVVVGPNATEHDCFILPSGSELVLKQA